MRIIISYAERRELSTHILSRDDKSKKKEDQLRSQPDGFMDEIQTQYAHTASYCATKMRFGPNDREQERKSASERNNHSKKNAYWRHFIFPTRAISVKWRVMLWRSGSKYSSDNQLYTGMPSSHTHALTRTPNALFFRPPRFVWCSDKMCTC